MQSSMSTLALFLGEPSEINYLDYVSSAMENIEIVADLLGSSSDDVADDTPRRGAVMLYQQVSTLRHIMKTWPDTQTYKVLKASNELIMAGDNEDETEFLYCSKDRSKWFLVHGNLAQGISNETARNWCEENGIPYPEV